jgi:hypothetical protein
MSAVTDLEKRQAALQDEAGAVLAELDLPALGFGPALPTGSVVSGLMVWRDLDVMVLGEGLSPGDVLRLLAPLADRPGFEGLALADERGPRSPTGEVRDERYHVPISWRHGDALWRIDLTVWLHDLHRNVTEWHERLRSTITPEQRTAVLRIKDAWHRRPEYPDEVGGADIYSAVLDDGVRDPEGFATWLTRRASSVSGA